VSRNPLNTKFEVDRPTKA